MVAICFQSTTTGVITGMSKRSAWREAAEIILFHRLVLLLAVVTSHLLLLRSIKRGMILSTPSSVAFWIAHSK